MNAEAITLPITKADDAVELIWQHVLAGDYPDVGSAARDLWRTFDLVPNERDFLALYGLTNLAEDRQRSLTQRRSNTPAIGWGAPHPKKWDAYVALTFPARAADGTQKPLIVFTRDDLAAFANHWGTIEQAARRRRKWATETDGLLEEHGAARIGDLPPLILRAVDESAREAMGRQS